MKCELYLERAKIGILYGLWFKEHLDEENLWEGKTVTAENYQKLTADMKFANLFR